MKLKNILSVFAVILFLITPNFALADCAAGLEAVWTMSGPICASITVPPGCANPADLTNKVCHPELHGSLLLPGQEEGLGREPGSALENGAIAPNSGWLVKPSGECIWNGPSGTKPTTPCVNTNDIFRSCDAAADVRSGGTVYVLTSTGAVPAASALTTNTNFQTALNNACSSSTAVPLGTVDYSKGQYGFVVPPTTTTSSGTTKNATLNQSTSLVNSLLGVLGNIQALSSQGGGGLLRPVVSNDGTGTITGEPVSGGDVSAQIGALSSSLSNFIAAYQARSISTITSASGKTPDYATSLPVTTTGGAPVMFSSIQIKEVIVPVLNVRTSPDRKNATVSNLKLGDRFTAIGYTTGLSLFDENNTAGNNKWWISSKNNYVWSGGTKDYVDTGTSPGVCTADAKVCPDGSSVGRTGPNCTFAACPTVTSTCPEGTKQVGSTNSIPPSPICEPATGGVDPKNKFISVSPAAGISGSVAIISGTAFPGTNNTVRFGNIEQQYLSSEQFGTIIKFVVPFVNNNGLSAVPLPSGMYKVTVTNSNGTSDPAYFTVTSPTSAGVCPTAGCPQ